LFFGKQDFNADISKWDTGKMTTMDGMFYGAWVFNIDLSKWNTGKVTTIQSMFYSAYSFNQNLSLWNVNKVAKPGTLDTSTRGGMDSMFYQARAFNFKTALDASWKTKNPDAYQIHHTYNTDDSPGMFVDSCSLDTECGKCGKRNLPWHTTYYPHNPSFPGKIFSDAVTCDGEYKTGTDETTTCTFCANNGWECCTTPTCSANTDGVLADGGDSYTEDLTTGQTATSSAADDSAGAAIDDDSNTQWSEGSAATGVGAWFQVTFDSAKHIRRISLQTASGNNVATGQKLQYSADGSTWVTAHEYTVDANANKQIFAIAASGSYTRWRLLSTTAVSNPYSWAINQLEMFEVALHFAPADSTEWWSPIRLAMKECLAETGDGSCPIFSASNGVMVMNTFFLLPLFVHMHN
jgi:surface protein